MRRFFTIGCMLGLIPLLVSGCGASRTTAQQRVGPPTDLYLFEVHPPNQLPPGMTLVPLDTQTLGDRQDRPPLSLATRFMTVSPDGAQLATFDYARTDGPYSTPSDTTVTVRDNRTGAARVSFHPPAPVLGTRLSRDGARLVVQPYPSGNPSPDEWDVLDTADGHVLTTVNAAPSNDYLPTLIDADAQALYRFITAAPAATAPGPRPISLIAYDLHTGAERGRLALPEVTTGSWPTGRMMQGEAVRAALSPGIALSPDGRQIAIAHADADRVTLIDTQRLTIARTISLTGGSGLLHVLGLIPQHVAAKGPPGVGTSRDAIYAPDGRSLYLSGFQTLLDDHDAQTFHSLGLTRLDLTRNTITANALPERTINWVLPAPDGQNIFVFGPKEGEGDSHILLPDVPSLLQRLDARTLAIQAAREFPSYRGGRLIQTPDAGR
ncbi:MAG: hypothetical protein ACR2M3_13270 [Thermomicrobiales bacterium]